MRQPPPRRLFLHLTLIVCVVLLAFPFVWMVLTSLKPYAEATQLPPSVLPHQWEFDNYAQAWNAAPFPRYFLNSVGVAGAVVGGVLISSILAAYAFAYMVFFGRDVLFVLFLATMMIPFETILIPNFVIVHQLGWYNTYAALIVPWTANVFSIFLLRQFFLGLPRELVDAAVIDGCGHRQFLWSIAVPLARPAVTVVALFNFLWSWNQLLWPLVVTSDEALRPVQLGLSVFLTEDGTYYQLLMAAATFTMLPIVVLYLAAQRQFVEGIAAGGVKG